MKQSIKTLERGTVFDYAGQRWIALEHDNNSGTLCLCENIIENRAFDDNNCNDWGKSSSRDYLNGPFLDNLIDAAGSGTAFLETEIDLTADDGLKDYGTCKATIFFLTADQYRKNRDVIPNADDWWWLATALSTASNGYENNVRCVFTGGTLDWGLAYLGYFGLRPACHLSSDVLISKEDTLTPEQAGQIVKELVERFCGIFAFRSQFYGAAGFLLNSLKELPEYEVGKEANTMP